MKRIGLLLTAALLSASMSMTALAHGSAHNRAHNRAHHVEQTTCISRACYEGCTIIVNTDAKEYHTLDCAFAARISDENKAYCSDAAYLDENGCLPCKNCH